MTDHTDAAPQNPPAPEKKNSRRIIIATLGVLLVIALAAVLASRAGLDKALVRQQLDLIAAQMRERGQAQGRDIAFTYGEITIQGGLSNRHAVIHDPVIRVKPLEAEGFEKRPADGAPQSVMISAPVLEIYPETASLSALLLSLPQPVNFTTIEEPNKSLMRVEANPPLAVRYAAVQKKDIPYTDWHFSMPGEMRLTYLREQRAEGAEEQTPTITPVYETLRVTTRKGAGSLSVQRNASAMGEGGLELSGITIAPESDPEAGKVTVKKIRSQWSNTRNAENLNVVQSSFLVDAIEADARLLPYAPVSMAMDVTYEGAMPSTPEEQGSIASQESAFKLKTFRITTKDASVNATADFVATPEDRLPVGMANVTVTNLPFIVAELKKYAVLDAHNESLLALLLQQITGTPYGDLTDVAIDVQRSRGGSFAIGKTTFEELFATLLQASLSQQRPADAIAPAAPAASDAPAPGVTEEKPATGKPLREETRG